MDAQIGATYCAGATRETLVKRPSPKVHHGLRAMRPRWSARHGRGRSFPGLGVAPAARLSGQRAPRRRGADADVRRCRAAGEFLRSVASRRCPRRPRTYPDPPTATTSRRESMKSHTIATAGVLALAACGCASAATLMDQIGPNGSFQQGLSNGSTQISNFYASAPQYNISVTDDFSLTGKAVLSGVEAALFATNGFGQLTALRVSIFDTQPTAANYAAGNVFNVDVPVANISFTSPWTTDSLTRLAAIDLSGYGLTLDAGTYWLSLVAQNNSFSSDIGILMSSFAGTPDNDNARQV